MTHRIWFFLAFLCLLISAGAILSSHRNEQNQNQLITKQPLKPNQLVISLTPTQDPDQLLKTAQPLIEFLEKELQLKVRVKTVTDYYSIVQALASDHVDIAFMPGLPTVLAMKTADCTPLCIEVQRGRTFYYSHIYVKRDSPIKTINDLKGHSIAFTDPVSSSGFLYPISLFYQKRLIQKGTDFNAFFKKVYWAGGYESALLAMYNGHVDASCGSQHAPNWYLDEAQRKEIRVLAQSGPLPTHGISARKKLGASFLKTLQNTLMKLNHEENKHILKNLYHAEGLKLADKSTYQDVLNRALATGLFNTSMDGGI